MCINQCARRILATPGPFMSKSLFVTAHAFPIGTHILATEGDDVINEIMSCATKYRSRQQLLLRASTAAEAASTNWYAHILYVERLPLLPIKYLLR